MSRFGKQESYNHKCKHIDNDVYRISWVIDAYKKGDRLRYPHVYEKYTNTAGAERFCKKHNCKITK